MKLTMLGTGSAAVTNCYNTCFLISDNKNHFLVDAGGGNQILKILNQLDIPITDIENIFITHSHTDHILGAVWLVRMIGQAINYDNCTKTFKIYCHEDTAFALKTMCCLTLPNSITKHFNDKIKIEIIYDNDEMTILNCNVRFFDIKSDKTKQFGFVFTLSDGKKLVCCGDEPISKHIEESVLNCDWLLCEAFCLYSEKDIFKPYQKFHSTVKDACETAERLNVKNLILYHTEDSDIKNRKLRYALEGSQYFSGNLLIPNDLESIEL